MRFFRIPRAPAAPTATTALTGCGADAVVPRSAPVVPVGSALGYENYGIGVPKDQHDMVRSVDGVPERIRGDGARQHLYDAGLRSPGPAPGPPTPHHSG